MSLRSALHAAMPAMFAHEGIWEGVYRHIGVDGVLIDEYRVRTRCELPNAGPHAYIQHNQMTWDDGRTAGYHFGGALVGDQLVWNTDRFYGHGWQSGELILLRLDRRDVADSHYVEMIDIAPGGQSRMRTWHWYQDGRPWKRTLCDERRIG